MKLAKKIAHEDYLFKKNGSPRILIELDRLSCPEEDPTKIGRFKMGVSAIVEWVIKSSEKDPKLGQEMALFKKNFKEYVEQKKENITKNKESAIS